MFKAVAFLLLFVPAMLSAQVQIDKSIQLTGTQNADRQVKNLGTPVDSTDGISVGAFQSGIHQYGVTTGSNGNYILALMPPVNSYTAGMTIRFNANHDNAGPATMDVNGLGAVALTKNGTNALAASDIQSGHVYEAIFDGTEFQLQKAGGSSSGGGNPDFTISSDKSTVTTAPGANSNHDIAVITCSLVNGSGSYLYPADTVLLSVSGLPANVTSAFSQSYGHLIPSFQVNLTFNAGGTVPTGNYTITVSATVKGVTKSVNITLNLVAGKMVFVTSGIWQGNFGGLGGGDSRCQTEANSAGYSSKTFGALLGDAGTHPKNRITDALYYRVDGNVVANSKADLLDGNIINAINLTATNINPGGPNYEVWTGSASDGNNNGYYYCSGWSTNCNNGSGSACFGAYGYMNGTNNSSWLGQGGGFCDSFRRFYCFEQ